MVEPPGSEPQGTPTVPNDPGRLAGGGNAPPPAVFRSKSATVGAWGKSLGNSPSHSGTPRAQLVRALLDTVDAAVEAGDLHAARVAHETVERLLETPAVERSTVADLAAERARRHPMGRKFVASRSGRWWTHRKRWGMVAIAVLDGTLLRLHSTASMRWR